MPEAGDGAQERAFARAALAHDEQAAAAEGERQVGAGCGLAAGRFHGDVVELEWRRFRRLVDLALRLLGLARVLGVELVEVVPEVAEAADAGGECAEPFDCAMMMDMAASTCAKAPSAWVTTPNSTAPRMNIGPTMRPGMISAR